MKKAIIIFIGTLLSVYGAFAERGIKIGVVDVETIVKELPEAVKADQELQALTKKFQDSLKAIENEFAAKMDKYNKQKSMMTPTQQKKTEEELKKLQQRYAQYQQEKLGVQGELAQKREKLLAPIREKVRKAIQKVAKREKMSFVFDKGSPVLLYSEEQWDITFSVLDLLKRKKIK